MSRPNISKAQEHRILARQRHRCANQPGSKVHKYLREYACLLWASDAGVFDEAGFEIDHDIQWSSGIADVNHDDNLQALCPNCHRRKTQIDREQEQKIADQHKLEEEVTQVKLENKSDERDIPHSMEDIPALRKRLYQLEHQLKMAQATENTVNVVNWHDPALIASIRQKQTQLPPGNQLLANIDPPANVRTGKTSSPRPQTTVLCIRKRRTQKPIQSIPQNSVRSESRQSDETRMQPQQTSRSLTNAEVKLVLSKLPLRERVLARLQLSMGLRIAEALALRWKQVYYNHKQQFLSEASWPRPYRRDKVHMHVVHLPTDAIHALEEWRQQVDHLNPEDYIFTGKAGGTKIRKLISRNPTVWGEWYRVFKPAGAIGYRYVENRYKRAMKDSGLENENVSSHSFRQTFAQRCKEDILLASPDISMSDLMKEMQVKMRLKSVQQVALYI